MRGERIGVFLIVTLTLFALGVGAKSISADSGSATFQYLIGTDFLCALDPSACPAIAEADNGDTIEIAGSGNLSTRPKSVTGGGTFTHKNSSGSVLGSGSWTAEQLISFNGYGCGGLGLPDNFCGGLAIIRVHLSPGFDAILQVDCAIGKVPSGHSEGVRLAIQDLLNFNRRVSGFTVFILPD